MLTTRSPERVAWTVLFGALITCITLSVGVPAAIFGYRNNATNEAFLRVRLKAGQLQTFSPVETRADARVVDLNGRQLKESHTALTLDRSIGSISFADAEQAQTDLTVLLYSNAYVQVTRARVPRFANSGGKRQLHITLRGGRIQIIAPPESGERFEVRVSVQPLDEARPTAEFETGKPGIYTFDSQANGAVLNVSVADGEVSFTTLADSAPRVLRGNQRASIAADGVARIDIPPAQNLVRNGYFESSLTSEPANRRDWIAETEIGAGENERGTLSYSKGELTFARVGDAIGWGRKSISQRIDQDVAGSTSLRLRIRYAIDNQSLEVCGSQGSECPLFVRVQFVTNDGDSAYWLQGFYARGNPDPDRLPTYIKSDRRDEHVRAELGQNELYESENLLAQIPNMRAITDISVYSEGHAIKTRVNSIELLLE
jgi:hypothetical protein